MELFDEGRGKFTVERFQNSVVNTMVQTGCCPIFTYPPPETEEELKAREFVRYEEAMSLSNNSTNAMQCIPRGCAPAIVAAKGSEIDADAHALHEEMVAMFNAHLVETDSEGSEKKTTWTMMSFTGRKRTLMTKARKTSDVGQHWSTHSY